MSNTTASLRRKIGGAGDLQSVVRTMKAVAASSIGQYEKSVSALADYYRTVELGLGACFRESGSAPLIAEREGRTVAGAIGAVVFGSDQGLVGQFNDVVADYAVKTLATLPAKAEVWAVGERVRERLADAGLPLRGLFTVPNSVKAITPLVGQILVESETRQRHGESHRTLPFLQPPQVRGGLCARQSETAAVGRSLATETGRTSLADGNLARGHGWRHARPCGRSSASIFSSRSSGRAPNPSRARTRAAWRRCNAPTRTSRNCWRTSTGHFIVCARMESTRNCSTSFPASKR